MQDVVCQVTKTNSQESRLSQDCVTYFKRFNEKDFDKIYQNPGQNPLLVYNKGFCPRF